MAKKYEGKHAGKRAGVAQNRNKRKIPILLKLLIILIIIGLVLFAALYIAVNHYTSKMDKTRHPDEGRTDFTAEEFWARQDELKRAEEAAAPSPETDPEAPAPVPEEPDEETLQIIAEADAAIEARQTASSEAAEENGEKPPKTAEKTENDIVNYLIIGSDRRDAIYGNSDVMIVASINRTTKKIHLTSLMRAMYVRIPSDSGGFNGGLNGAFSMAGAPLCVKTIELNFGLDIDHYVVFDFYSFQKVIDALGGVDVELSKAEAGKLNYLTLAPFHEGVNHLNGEQALAFARERHLDNDFKRTGRQRRIVTACIQSLKGCSLSELNELANTVLPYVQTDMSNMDIILELPNALSYVNYDIDQLMLPVENMEGRSYYGITFIYGHEVYVVDWDNNLTRLQEFINS